MDKQKFKTTQLILSIVTLFLLFVPGFFTREIWEATGFGTATLVHTSSVSFFTATFGGDGDIAFILMALVLIAGIIFSARGLKSKKEINPLIQHALTILPAIIVFLFHYSTTNKPVGSIRYSPEFLYYIVVGVIFVNFALPFFGSSAKGNKPAAYK